MSAKSINQKMTNKIVMALATHEMAALSNSCDRYVVASVKPTFGKMMASLVSFIQVRQRQRKLITKGREERRGKGIGGPI